MQNLRLALRNILRQRRRALIAILAISSGVIAILLAAGYIEWIFWANREGTISNQFGHLQVVKPGYHEGGKADPFNYLLPQDSPALQALKKDPAVRSVAPRISFTGLVSHGETTVSFIGEGIDPAQDPSTDFVLIVEGRRLTAKDGKGILMGAGLAANLGVKSGDNVVLLANTPSGGINAVEAPVVGLASVSMKAFDDAVLRIPIDMARNLLRVPGAHVWLTMLKNTDLTDATVLRLQKNPAFRNYEVVPWSKLADFYNKTVDLFSRQINLIKLIIAVIIVLSISNTMTMAVMERTTEIGTAMALGVRKRHILSLFLLEGGLLGLIGGLVGVVTGYALALLISAVGIPMPPAPGMSRGFVAAIIVTPGIIGQAWLIAITTTLLASLYPAWRASRLEIVDALRHNK